MKKIFTLIILAMAVVTAAQAQTITINKTDGTKVTYDASEVSSIDFAPKSDTTTIHSFTGYLLVSSAYFQNMYYGDAADERSRRRRQIPLPFRRRHMGPRPLQYHPRQRDHQRNRLSDNG